MIDLIAIVATSALAGLEWSIWARSRTPRSLGLAVFTTLLAIAVMVN